MNTKYALEPDVLYTPENNEKLIFDIYVNYLPISIKTLLIQNNIRSISLSYTFCLENNLLKDIPLIKTNASNFPNNSVSKRNNGSNFNNPHIQHHSNLNRNFSIQNRLNNGVSNNGNLTNTGNNYFPNHISQQNFDLRQSQPNVNRNFGNNRGPMNLGQNQHNFYRDFSNNREPNNLRQNEPNSYGNLISNQEPMEIGAISTFENFHIQPQRYHYP